MGERGQKGVHQSYRPTCTQDNKSFKRFPLMDDECVFLFNLIHMINKIS